MFFFLFNLCFSPSSVVSFITLCEMFYALGIWFQSGEGLGRILFRFDSHINKIAKKMKCKLEITAFFVVLYPDDSSNNKVDLTVPSIQNYHRYTGSVYRECSLQMSGAEPAIKG